MYIDRCRSVDQKVRINVSGYHFETALGVLDRHPGTLLGDRLRRAQFYDRERGEFFFDRHRPSFEAIFVYYQRGGRLRRPDPVPDDVFLDELVFYELEPDAIDEYRRSEGHTTEKVTWPSNARLRRIWMVFEFPETSRFAFVVAVWSVLMTLLSIILFCVETLPAYAMTHCEEGQLPNFLDAFFLGETLCTAWFTATSFRGHDLLPLPSRTASARSRRNYTSERVGRLREDFPSRCPSAVRVLVLGTARPGSPSK